MNITLGSLGNANGLVEQAQLSKSLSLGRSLSVSQTQDTTTFMSQLPALRFGRSVKPLTVPISVSQSFNTYDTDVNDNDRYGYGPEIQDIQQQVAGMLKDAYIGEPKNPGIQKVLLKNMADARYQFYTKNYNLGLKGEKPIDSLTADEIYAAMHKPLSELVQGAGMFLPFNRSSKAEDYAQDLRNSMISPGEYDKALKVIEQKKGALAAAVLSGELTSALDTGAGTTVMASAGLTAGPIGVLGTPEQIEEYYVPLITGQKIGAYGLTEPTTHGSNPAKIKAEATKTETGWKLSGEKLWITNANVADFYLITARVNNSPIKNDNGNLGAFIVKREQLFDTYTNEEGKVLPRGFTQDVGEKMGMKTSDTAQITLNKVEIPDNQRLGGPDAGTFIYQDILSEGRLNVALGAARISEDVIKQTAQYVIGRNTDVFGQVREKLGDGVALAETAKLLSIHAARLKGEVDHLRETKNIEDPEVKKLFTQFMNAASVAKLFATEWTAPKVIDDGIQLHGGNGYLKLYGLSEKYEDTRVTRIYEGPTETQRNLIFMSAVQEHAQKYGKNFTKPFMQALQKPATDVFDFMDKVEKLCILWTYKQARNRGVDVSKISDVMFKDKNVQFHSSKTADVITWNQALKTVAVQAQRLEEKGIDTRKERAVLDWVANKALSVSYKNLAEMGVFRTDTLVTDVRKQNKLFAAFAPKMADSLWGLNRKEIQDGFQSWADTLQLSEYTVERLAAIALEQAGMNLHNSQMIKDEKLRAKNDVIPALAGVFDQPVPSAN